MATYKEALISSSPTAAWMLDSSGATDSNLVVGGSAASVTVDDRQALPLCSGAARSFTFTSSADQILYPNVNIWNVDHSGTPFSIEFVVKPYNNTNEIVILQPLSLSGPVPGNSISLINNKLSFAISSTATSSGGTVVTGDSYTSGSYNSSGQYNGSGSTETPGTTTVLDSYEAYSYLGFYGGTYHCVAIYKPGAISLYINNELVSSTSIPNSFKWNHGFGVDYAMRTSGGDGSQAVVSGLSIYKGELNPSTIASHYKALMTRSSAIEIVSSSGGTPFMINDSDRQKSFFFNSPRLNAWDEAVLDNVSIIDNKLSLDVIEPPKLTYGVEEYTSSRLNLSASQGLQIDNVERFFSSSDGAFGTFFRYTSDRHGALASGEYSLFSLFNSDKTSQIDIVEKSDKKMYLRYTSNNIAFADALLYTPSSNTDNYIYVVFNSTEIKAYFNNILNFVSIPIASDGGTAAPRFDTGSTLLVGCSSNLSNFWGSQVWHLNIWSNIRDISGMSTFIEETYQYTLKLESNLNVSQKGSANWAIDTGYDGTTDFVSQSRVWWEPSLPSSQLLVETGTSGVSTPTPETNQSIIDETAYFDSYADGYGQAPLILDTVNNMISIVGATAGSSVPEVVYVRATLATDDSVNNVVYLKKMGIDILSDASVIAESGQDQIIFKASPVIHFSMEGIGLQEYYQGARLFSVNSACQIYSDYATSPTTDDSNVPEVSDDSAPSTELSMAKTIEFFARPIEISSGIIFKYNGTDSHSLSYDTATRVFNVTGFDKLYIDGAEVTISGGATTARPAGFNNKWHMFHLVKNDVIAQNDETMFTAISGSPAVSIDSSKFYSGNKSFKVAAGGSVGAVELYNSISSINTGSGAKNTLSFFVYPNTGVTSITVNFRYNSTDSSQTFGVVAGKWNLITRTFTNPTTVTTMSVRVGPTLANQTIWIDGASLVKGADPFIKFKSTTSESSWFGFDPANPDVQQAVFLLQNVGTYNKPLRAYEIASNFNSYMGNLSVKLNGNSANLVPPSGFSATEPTAIRNRNPRAAQAGQSAEVLFEHNPLFLSSGWQILTTN